MLMLANAHSAADTSTSLVQVRRETYVAVTHPSSPNTRVTSQDCTTAAYYYSVLAHLSNEAIGRPGGIPHIERLI